MRIKAIAAKRFRTLEEFYIEFNPHYCAISGRNNAGKSALVSIIEHFLDDAETLPFNTSGISISHKGDHT